MSIKDIAQALNLSKATISWILSGQGEAKGFSATTIKRVKDYAESVNYRPNLLARSLSLGTSNTIGLIIPFLRDTFYAQLAQAIELEAGRHKYTLIVCSSEGNGDREYEIIRMLKAKQVDGIIIAPTKISDNWIGLLSDSSVPYILVDRYYPNLQSNYVIVNNKDSSYGVTCHLAKKGARKIAFLTTDVHLYVMTQRSEGYQLAVADLGLANDEALNVLVDHSNLKKDIVEKLDKLFVNVPDVDGFFFSTHYLALEAIRYFIKHDIDYHQRFKMGCFHYTTGLDILDPEMCTTCMPIDEMGTVAVDTLVENIKEGKEFTFRQVVLENKFYSTIASME